MAYNNDNKTDNNKTEVKHAVVHHVEKNVRIYFGVRTGKNGKLACAFHLPELAG